MDIQYTNFISEADYNRLRKSVGWNEIPVRQAQTGLKNTAFQVVALVDDTPIGMARVIRDGGYVVLISDVVVHPKYQGYGIGRTMMEKIMDYIRNGMEPGDRILINLLAAKDKEPFYVPFGFEVRPTQEHGAGMSQWIIK